MLKNKMGLVDLLRAQSVKRWTIVHTSKNQSLAEHSFNVCMIARAVCKHMSMDDTNVIKGALVHDLDEIRTGDIPTPFKKAALTQGIDLNAVYTRVTDRSLSHVEQRIIKFADTLEAYWFITEFGVGKLGVAVENKLRRAVEDLITIAENENPNLGLAFKSVHHQVMVMEPEV